MYVHINQTKMSSGFGVFLAVTALFSGQEYLDTCIFFSLFINQTFLPITEWETLLMSQSMEYCVFLETLWLMWFEFNVSYKYWTSKYWFPAGGSLRRTSRCGLNGGSMSLEAGFDLAKERLRPFEVKSL